MIILNVVHTVMVEEQARKYMGEHTTLPPGIMYEGSHFMLGLGDFVFYGGMLSMSRYSYTVVDPT